jgi:hypothetical protein
MKTEFHTPYHSNNGKRKWKPVLLELNSTQLIVHELKADKKLHRLILALYHDRNYLEEQMNAIINRKGVSVDFVEDLFSGDAYGGTGNGNDDIGRTTSFKSKYQHSKLNASILHDFDNNFDTFKDNKMLFEPSNSLEDLARFAAIHKGDRLHVFTMQNLTVGEAPSIDAYSKNATNLESFYTLVKYRNTLRARVEFKQLLLQFWSFHGMAEWYRHFSIAHDLSTSIDERKVSKIRSIPTRFRRWEDDAVAESHTLNAGVGIAAGTESKDSESLTESIFDRSRSSSMLSSSSMSLTTPTASQRGGKPSKSGRLVSMEDFYSPMERSYISNCIIALNTFDKWVGLPITISNYQKYLTPEQINEIAKNKFTKKDAGIFIVPSKLDENSLWSFKKKSPEVWTGECRQFIVHQHGLVGLA